MIIEQRRYTLKPFTIKEYFRIYEKEGLPIQTRHFPRMIGYFNTEIGPLNEIIHMWGFESFEHRLKCRSQLAADPEWQTYAVQVRPMIEKQECWLLNPAPFSPIR